MLCALTTAMVGLSGVLPDAHAAVFGRDDRSPVPENLSRLEEQIGRLHNPVTGTNCTAFCVAPNIVATAAHCLFRKPAGRILRMTDFRFDVLRGGKRQQTSIEGAANRSAGQHIITGTTRLRIRPPIDAAADWALMRTQTNICEGRALPIKVETIRQIEESSDRNMMFQVAFHSDYQDWVLAWSQPCKVRAEFPELRTRTIRRDFKNTASLILHQCDTKGASSGSPILKMTDQGPVVVGINVGTYVQSKVLIRNGEVARKFDARPVANTGVNAAVFAPYVDVLRNAEILTAKEDIQQIQTALHRADLYRGSIDGVFGNRTRLAIKNYQRAQNRLPTGLPTTAMLAVMAVSAPPVPARKPARKIRNAAASPDAIARLLRRVD